MTARLCDVCSVLSETEKTFCPECGTPYDRSLRQPDWRPAGHSRGLPLTVKLIAWLPLLVSLLAWIYGLYRFQSVGLGARDLWRLVVFVGVGLAISLGSSKRALCFLPLAVELARIQFGGLFLNFGGFDSYRFYSWLNGLGVLASTVALAVVGAVARGGSR